MSIEAQIKTCSTPQEALLLLAREIDALWKLNPPQPADPWQQPLEWGGIPVKVDPDLPPDTIVIVADGGPEAVTNKLAEQIAAVEEQLATAIGEDHEALTARLRLLKDQAGMKVYDKDSGGGSKMGEGYVPAGQQAVDDQPFTAQGSPTQAIQVNGGVVQLPKVSPEREAARQMWAVARELWNFIPLDEQTAQGAYAKGGPMWLYLSNRPAVMAMPYEWRRELVQEIQLDSPKQAQEVGRDILKSMDSVPQENQLEAIDQIRAARG